MRSLSTYATTAVDSPHVDLIRLLKIEFTGLTLRLCDRYFDVGDGAYVFDSQIWEPAAIEIGPVRLGRIDPITWETGISEAEVTVSNSVPLGGSDWFSLLFSSNDPHYAAVTIYDLFYNGGSPTGSDAVTIFSGYIEDVHTVTATECRFAASGSELYLSRRFSFLTCDPDNFTDAMAREHGKMFPIVLGSAKKVPFVHLNDVWQTTMAEEMTSSSHGGGDTFAVADASGMPSSGAFYITVDLETIKISSRSSDTLTIDAATGRPFAADHVTGSEVMNYPVPYSSYRYYAVDGPIDDIGNRYFKDEKDYTAGVTERTGQSGDTTDYSLCTGDYANVATIKASTGLRRYWDEIKTLWVGRATADVDGMVDDASGTVTGTASLLIERPDHCMKFVLDRCGLDVSTDVDSTSYTAAGSYYSTNSYALGYAILQPPNVHNLLNRLAVHAASLQFFDGGKHYLIHRPTSPTTALTIDPHRVDLGQVQVAYTPRSGIVNEAKLEYKRDWSGRSDNLEVAKYTVSCKDTISSKRYGKLEGEAISMPGITTEAHAQAVLNRTVADLAEPRVIVKFAGGPYLEQVQRGDILEFDVTDSDDGSGEWYLYKECAGLVDSGTQYQVIGQTIGSDGQVWIEAVEVRPPSIGLGVDDLSSESSVDEVTVTTV